MTPLDRIIREVIASEGPISISRYMALCLSHPEHGYYITRDPLGAAGDFTTAPEISQLFGELIGAWLVHVWKELGQPSPVALVELGPGRGTLMADIWRVARTDTTFADAATIHLVETSPALRARQNETLGKLSITPHHHDTLASLPNQPTLVVANEFLDALPTNQWQRAGTGWCERKVGVGDDGSLVLGLDLAAGPAPKPVPNSLPVGTILEHSPAQDAIMADLASRLGTHGGAGLLIDYGALKTGTGDTMQAVHDHKRVDALSDPGLADLTTHIDFEHMAKVASANGIPHVAGATQGDFLLRLGLLERAGQLGAGKSADQQHAISMAVERLAGDAAMGRLFKVMGLASHAIALPGLESDVWSS